MNACGVFNPVVIRHTQIGIKIGITVSKLQLFGDYEVACLAIYALRAQTPIGHLAVCIPIHIFTLDEQAPPLENGINTEHIEIKRFAGCDLAAVGVRELPRPNHPDPFFINPS